MTLENGTASPSQDILTRVGNLRLETAPSVAHFKFNKKRVRVISDVQDVPEENCGIVYWMSRDQRVQGNYIPFRGYRPQGNYWYLMCRTCPKWIIGSLLVVQGSAGTRYNYYHSEYRVQGNVLGQIAKELLLWKCIYLLEIMFSYDLLTLLAQHWLVYLNANCYFFQITGLCCSLNDWH